MLNAVVHTYGGPAALAHLKQLPQFDQILIVVDHTLRKHALYHEDYPLARFVQDVDALTCLRNKRLLIHDAGAQTESTMASCLEAGVAVLGPGPCMKLTEDFHRTGWAVVNVPWS